MIMIGFVSARPRTRPGIRGPDRIVAPHRHLRHRDCQARTEKLVYINSNLKAVAAAARAEDFHMA